MEENVESMTLGPQTTSIDKVMADALNYRLITKASDEFDRHNYTACIDILKQLECLKEYVYKVAHNKAVANFYKEHCMSYKELVKDLMEIDAKKDDCVSDKDVTAFPFTKYNKAVIYYHRHMYKNGLDIIESLLDKVYTYDESVLAVLGALELRLLLASNQIKKALCFLEVLLQKMGINILQLTAEEFSSQEPFSKFEDNVRRSLKLMSLLTQIVNKRAVLVPEDGSPEFSALKAHQYYIMKDFQMAAKQLKKINVSGYVNGLYNQELNTLVANNMGVIHLRVRHYAIAANFFQNAISFDKQIALNIRNIQLHHMSSAKSCEILYNLGITMMHLRRPAEAFRCFLVPLKTYHNNPRLWFRIAEACIMKHEIGRFDVKQLTFNGVSTHRMPYLENSSSSAVLEPTLTFAALSLRNALTLLQFYRKKLEDTQINKDSMTNVLENENWLATKDNNFCPPSRPVTKQSFYILLSSIYAAYSYVSLRLGDYVTALEMAEELLKTEDLSDAHKMLARMYAGEALIMMHRLPDARLHLEPTFVSNLNTFDFETKDWKVKSLDAAQNVVRYNYAVSVFLQGDIEMARNLLNTCTHPIVSQKVLKKFIKCVFTHKAESPYHSFYPYAFCNFCAFEAFLYSSYMQCVKKKNMFYQISLTPDIFLSFICNLIHDVYDACKSRK